MTDFRLPEPFDRFVVVGMTGQGKGERIKKMLKVWLSRGVKVVALDCKDEYSRHGKYNPGLVNLGPLKNRVTAAQLAADPSLLNDPRLSLAVVPNESTPKARARTFIMLAKMMKSLRRCVLLVDEVGSWTNAEAHPVCVKARVELELIATEGRHEGHALIACAQFATQIPKAVRRQSSEWWLFRQDEESDLEAIAGRLGNDIAEQVRQLQRFECVTWRNNNQPPDAKRKLRAV